MSVVNLPQARHTAQLVDEKLIVNIPSRTNWLQILFLLVWLAFWLFGWSAGLFGLISAGGAGLFMLFWLVFWTIGGLAVMLSLLWQLTGREIIVVDDKALRIKWQLWGFSWLKTYLAADVGSLRVSPVVYAWHGRSRQLSYWWNGCGPIAFDYGAKTYRFGDGVDEAEAKQIVKLIQKQFPQYEV